MAMLAPGGGPGVVWNVQIIYRFQFANKIVNYRIVEHSSAGS